jgi:hypothetical protein
VPLDERRHHVALELLGVVEDVVVDAEDLRDPPGVVDVADRATTRVRRAAPELQRGADDLVALFDQESRGHRRIDAATHRYEDFHRPSLPVEGVAMPRRGVGTRPKRGPG